METSNTMIELAKALSKMQGALKSVPKSSTNPFFKAKYADLDAVWDTVRKPLTDNGLSVIQTTYDQNEKIYLETMLLHTSGEWIRSCLPINAKEQNPQAIGSAITYARRYAISAILGVSADEDDDAEGTTDHKPAKPTENPGELKAHWCPIHNVAFKEMKGKDGKQKWYSHKAGDEWCNEKKADLPEGNFEKLESAGTPAPVKEKPAREITKIKNIGDLYNAIFEDYPERFKSKLAILQFAGKKETDIADPAMEYMNITEKIGKETPA
jgi:hypothetical protein